MFTFYYIIDYLFLYYS